MQTQVTVNANMHVHVICEKCGKEFSYVRKLEGVGTALSKQVAERDAWSALISDANNKHQNQHWGHQRCPNCRHTQLWMRRDIIAQRSRFVAIPVAILVFLVSLGLLSTGINSGVILCGGAIVAFIVYYLINDYLKNKYSPALQQDSETTKLPLVKYEPDLAQMSYIIGKDYMAANNPRLARGSFETALTFNPDYFIAHRETGIALLTIFLQEGNNPPGGELLQNPAERGLKELEIYITKSGQTEDEEVNRWKEKIKGRLSQ